MVASLSQPIVFADGRLQGQREEELRQRADEDVAIMRTCRAPLGARLPPYQLTRFSYLQLRRRRHFLLAAILFALPQIGVPRTPRQKEMRRRDSSHPCAGPAPVHAPLRTDHARQEISDRAL